MMREYDENKKAMRVRAHSVMLENRERAVFSGVEDVESFNEDEVILVTEAGVIALVGQGLHISKLNLDDGQLVVEGYIQGVDYEQMPQQKQGLLSKLFK
jgi:sporulation protein YabP